MENKSAKVIISLLTWNGLRYLPSLISSIKAQSFHDWDILIMDNGSNDDPFKIIDDYLPQATVVKQKNNVGFSRGHNLNINWSNSDYVLVLNQDVIMDEDYLSTLVEFMDKHPQAGSCSGKILRWDFASGQKTKEIDSLGIKINRQRHIFDDQQGDPDYKLENTEVFAVSAVAVLYRRKALESVAMPQGDYYEFFDEDFFAYKEDVDLGWRLRLAGWENWLVANAKAYHDRTVSGGHKIRFMFKHRSMANNLSYRNHLMLLYKNSFGKNIIKDFWPIAWYEIRKFVYLLFFERETLGGLNYFFKKLKFLKKKRSFIMSRNQQNPKHFISWFR